MQWLAAGLGGRTLQLEMVITRGSGENSSPSHSSTTRMTPDDRMPTSCVFPPELACMRERERLPAAVKELKNEDTMLVIP